MFAWEEDGADDDDSIHKPGFADDVPVWVSGLEV